MESTSSTITFMNVKADWLKVGTAIITAQLMSQKSLTDKDWMKSALLTLIGFTVFNLVTAKLVDTNKFVSPDSVKKALDDLFKVGTMLVVSRTLSGNPLNDEEWIKESSYTLLGFIGFDLVVGNLINLKTMDPKSQLAVNDIAKFTTMNVISRFLSGKEFSKEWMVECGGFMTGLVAYDYLMTEL